MNLAEAFQMAVRNILGSKMRTFLTMLGIIFGYLPAKKAANLNPIDALRCD